MCTEVRKKEFAMAPSERNSICVHVLVSYTGRIPNTGSLRCSLCGMTFEHTEEVREARQAAYDAIEAAKAGAVAPGASLLSERQIARALSLNSKPRTWNELGDVVSLLNPAGGLKLNTEATKAISVALQIPACDVRAAFDVFMWSMTPPARPVPVIRKGCPS